MQCQSLPFFVLAMAAGMFGPVHAMAETPPEMKVLDGFVGTWKVEQTSKSADGRELTAPGFTTPPYVLGVRYLEYVPHTNPGDQESLGMFTYDAAQGKYRSWFFSSGGQHSEWSGTWDDKTRTLTRTAELPSGHVATGISTFVDDDTLDFSIVARRPDGTVVFELTSRLTRQVNAAPVVHRKSAGWVASRAELEPLDRMAGMWSDEAVMKRAEWTPEEVRLASESESFWTLGGTCLLQMSEEAVFLTTYSAAEKSVKMWHFNASGYIHEWTGDWDDANSLTLRSDLDGHPDVSSGLKQRFIGNDTTTLSAIATDKAGKVYYRMEGTSKRRN